MKKIRLDKTLTPRENFIKLVKERLLADGIYLPKGGVVVNDRGATARTPNATNPDNTQAVLVGVPFRGMYNRATITYKRYVESDFQTQAICGSATEPLKLLQEDWVGTVEQREKYINICKERIKAVIGEHYYLYGSVTKANPTDGIVIQMDIRERPPTETGINYVFQNTVNRIFFYIQIYKDLGIYLDNTATVGFINDIFILSKKINYLALDGFRYNKKIIEISSLLESTDNVTVGFDYTNNKIHNYFTRSECFGFVKTPKNINDYLLNKVCDGFEDLITQLSN